MPEPPKPPISSVAPSRMPETASVSEGMVLSSIERPDKAFCKKSRWKNISPRAACLGGDAGVVLRTGGRQRKAGTMRLAIIGTGAMGSVYAGLLADAGLDVCAVDVWGEHVDAINRGGLRVSGASGER